jgi:DNA-directed RNA polymerase
MTTNYGVTLYGARQQIGRQLRDIDKFPKEFIPEASSYLAQKTFFSLRELFRETRKIQVNSLGILVILIVVFLNRTGLLIVLD